MANPRATVKQAELTRYLGAWRKAGYPPPRMEVRPDVTVIIVPVDDKNGEALNDWDS